MAQSSKYRSPSPDEIRQMEEEWKAQNPFKFSGGMPDFSKRRMPADDQPEESGKSADAKGKAMDTGSYEPSPMNLPAPSPYILAALGKPESARTLQERKAIADRRKVEELTTASGDRVKDAITPGMIADEKAQEIGRYDATLALSYNRGHDATLAAAGFAADGTKLPATPAVSPMAPQSVQAPAPAGPGGAPAPRGFASRKMADGTIRTASGVDAAGSSIMRDFGTQEEAFAYYRPTQPAQAPAAPAAQALTPAVATPAAAPAPAKPKGTAQPRPFGPEMADVVPASPAPAAAPMKNPMKRVGLGDDDLDSMLPPAPYVGGTVNVDAAKTTAPTTRFNMVNREMGTPLPRGRQALSDELNPFATRAY